MDGVKFAARLYDGRTAAPQLVDVTWEPGTDVLVFRKGNNVVASWPLVEVRRLRDIANTEMTFWRKDDEDAARLLVHPGDAPQLVALLPKLDSRDMNGSKWRKIVTWTGGAAAAIYLMVFGIVPALAAQMVYFIKPETEVAIGRASLSQIERFMNGTRDGEWFCADPAGQAAIDTMVARLTDGQDIGYDLQVRAVDNRMLNAFALPGGQVVLMKGLIDAADTPDQVAGVLAHEIGHVALRHPMKGALRAAGSAGLLSLIFGDATGGTVIALVTESLVTANYTRAAEAEADDIALRYLKASNVSPTGFAEFFELLVKEYGESSLPEWASTHPPSADRALKARGADTADTTPILNDEEWAALKSACG